MDEPTELTPEDAERARRVQEFWEAARVRAGLMRTAVVTGMTTAATMPPPAWAFGDNPTLADELLELVLAGTKTATATSLTELEADGDRLPEVGDLSIVLDGSGEPRALIRTTEVHVTTFDQVTEEQAHAEGEDDRTLASWRREHERYFRRVLEPLGTAFSQDLPIVLETFEVLYPRPSDR